MKLVWTEFFRKFPRELKSVEEKFAKILDISEKVLLNKNNLLFIDHGIFFIEVF